MAVYLSRQMGPRQAKWHAVTQERVAATSIVLGFVKSIKMMGFSKHVQGDIQALRDKEIRTFKVFRRYTVFLNALGEYHQPRLQFQGGRGVANLPFYAGPMLTFAVFALLGKGDFTTERAFTSLTLISLLELSTLRFIASLPQVAAAAGCLKRLDEFLSDVRPVKSTASSAMSNLEENEPMENSERQVVPGNNDQRPLFLFLAHPRARVCGGGNSNCARHLCDSSERVE